MGSHCSHLAQDPSLRSSCVWAQTEKPELCPKSGRQRLCLREQEWHPGSLASALLGVSLGREQLLSKSGYVGCLWANPRSAQGLREGSWCLVTVGTKCTCRAIAEGVAVCALWPGLTDPLLRSRVTSPLT